MKNKITIGIITLLLITAAVAQVITRPTTETEFLVHDGCQPLDNGKCGYTLEDLDGTNHTFSYPTSLSSDDIRELMKQDWTEMNRRKNRIIPDPISTELDGELIDANR